MVIVGDSVGEKPQGTETRDKGRTVLRTSSTICPRDLESESWTDVPLPQILFEKCPLVLERK